MRVYRRALSAAEIQADMTTPITSQDAAPPSAPGTLSATGGLGQVALTWGAATDNTGVVRYNVHRSTTAGFTPSAANRIAQPTGTTYTNTGLAPGVYYYKVTAEDAAGNVGPPSNEANGTAAADTTPPTAPTNLSATGGAGQVALGWSASTDTAGIARYNVHRSTIAGFTPSAANRIAQPTGTGHTDTGLAAGTYYYRVIAEDPSGNAEPALERGDRECERRATQRAGRRVQHGSGLRHLAPRPLRHGQQRHDQRCDVVDERQVRERAQLQRHEQHRERPRLELARPHDGDDARGVGAADVPRREVAHRAPQGAVR